MRGVVPYTIGVDIGCDVAVETMAPDELDRVLEAIDAGRQDERPSPLVAEHPEVLRAR